MGVITVLEAVVAILEEEAAVVGVMEVAIIPDLIIIIIAILLVRIMTIGIEPSMCGIRIYGTLRTSGLLGIGILNKQQQQQQQHTVIHRHRRLHDLVIILIILPMVVSVVLCVARCCVVVRFVRGGDDNNNIIMSKMVVNQRNVQVQPCTILLPFPHELVVGCFVPYSYGSYL